MLIMDEIHVHKTKKSICAHFDESPCITAALNPSVVRDLWSSGIVTCMEDYRSQVQFAVR